MYVMRTRHPLRLCDKNGDLLQCSRVNPYARMRMRFSNCCVSDKLYRFMSRIKRHPIEKNGGGIPGNDVADGTFPRQVWGGLDWANV